MSVAPGAIDYHRAIRPAGWIVYEQTATSLELRDPDVSLPGAACDAWLLIVTALTMLLLASGLFAIYLFLTPAIFALILAILSLANAILCCHCIWQRWRNPSLMRISGGKFFLHRRHGGNSDELERDVRDIILVETSHRSSTFHSHYSIRVHFRDGSRVPFLHCRNGYEGNWVVKLIEATVAMEMRPGFPANADQPLQPTMTTLPPPPLAASLRHRVAAIEERIIEAPPPVPQDSQSASSSQAKP